MTGDGFIRLAGKLVAQSGLGDDDSRFRSAVSRAYYGAFHLATSQLASWQFVVRKNACGHQETYNLLWGSGQPDARRVASLLDDLRTERIKADYRLDDLRFQTSQMAVMCVEMAETLKRALEKCRDQEEAIQEGIRQWIASRER